MSKTKIYCIPGLGLDERLFQKLSIAHADLRFLNWKKPLADESIQDYAKRMAEELPEDDDICLLGVSLGGMISIEISQFRKIKQLILISTVKNHNEMPNYMSWLDRLPANSQTAARFGIDASIALKPFYDNADKKGNELFHQMLKDADIEFINWAIHQIAKWKFEKEIETPFLHIHGTNDLIFPIKNIDRAITIKNGTHFMVYNQGEKISKIIEESLNRI